MCTCPPSTTECWHHFNTGFPFEFEGCTANTTIDYLDDGSLANDVDFGIMENPICLKASCREGLTADISITFTCFGILINTDTNPAFPMEESAHGMFPDQLACINSVA